MYGLPPPDPKIPETPQQRQGNRSNQQNSQAKQITFEDIEKHINAMPKKALLKKIVAFDAKFRRHMSDVLRRGNVPKYTHEGIIKREAETRGIYKYKGIWVQSVQGRMPTRVMKLIDGKDCKDSVKVDNVGRIEVTPKIQKKMDKVAENFNKSNPKNNENTTFKNNREVKKLDF